jgi:hypothetical protein
MFRDRRGVDLRGGELLTLASSAARTSNGTGDWVYLGGARQRLIVVLTVTASATDATDTLDVFVDVSLDGTNAIANAIHFAQQAGNGAAKTEVAVLDAATPGTSSLLVTSDAAAGAVRPAVFGAYYRARWAIVDGGGNANSSHTFRVQAYGV